MTNLIKIILKSTNVNGWPCVKIKTNNTDFQAVVIDQELTSIELPVSICQGQNCVMIERYGKTDQNYTPLNDQTVEVSKVSVDGVEVPDFILDKFSSFEFNQQTHVGSRYFCPNGVWKFEFQTPIITWILDQKILHESQYNQDYIYPWSYKFGPESVARLDIQLMSVYNKVQQIL
jgi:hypothetical protein